MKKRILISALFSILLFDAHSQNSSNGDSLKIAKEVKASEPKSGDEKKIEIVQMMQLWDVATLSNFGNTGREQRNDIYIRRGRIGVKGKIRKDVSFNVVFAYDGIGRDKKTAGQGTPNDVDNRDFYLWDGFLTYTYKPMLNIVAGYFRPQFGRENITAAFKVLSFEKSLANFQPRTHVLNRNTGREMGVNIGGLYIGNGWSFNYNVGAFDLTSEKLIGTNGSYASLFTSRAAITIGDPEMDSYGISYANSYYGKRKGITLALNGTYTGETDIFKNNGFYGADILANYGKWDFNAEYDWLYRDSYLNINKATKFTSDQVYAIRLGYNFILKSGKIIQATGMYSGQQAQNFGIDSGVNALTKANDQVLYDLGLNYLINKDNLKFNLHYVWGKRKQFTSDPDYSYVGFGFQWMM